MTPYRYIGIPATLAAQARESRRSPQYGHPAHREVARGYGPCRLCLRTFKVDQEDRLLFTYQPFEDPGSLPAPGPVFVHAEPCERYDACELPPDFRQLPLVIEGFRPGGGLVVQLRVGLAEPEAAIGEVLEWNDVAYAHIRNAEAGCFMARVERASDADCAAPRPR